MATVEKLRYAFLLFSIILTVSTVVYFASRMSCFAARNELQSLEIILYKVV